MTNVIYMRLLKTQFSFLSRNWHTITVYHLRFCLFIRSSYRWPELDSALFHSNPLCPRPRWFYVEGGPAGGTTAKRCSTSVFSELFSFLDLLICLAAFSLMSHSPGQFAYCIWHAFLLYPWSCQIIYFFLNLHKLISDPTDKGRDYAPVLWV